MAFQKDTFDCYSNKEKSGVRRLVEIGTQQKKKLKNTYQQIPSQDQKSKKIDLITVYGYNYINRTLGGSHGRHRHLGTTTPKSKSKFHTSRDSSYPRSIATAYLAIEIKLSFPIQ